LGTNLPAVMRSTMVQMPGLAPVSELLLKVLRRVSERARGDRARGGGWTLRAVATRRCEVSVRRGGKRSVRAAERSRAHAQFSD
jgi:hypothetical protein